MMSGWKFLGIEVAIFGVVGLIFYLLERYALRQLTEEKVRRWGPQQVTGLFEGAETTRVLAKALRPFTLLALGAVLFLTLTESARLTFYLGLALAIVFLYFLVCRLARFLRTMHLRVQSLVAERHPT